ncbi:peptidase [Bacillus methanolicus]|uniref:Mov34/MPN/PAD-1 family protein n=1 Tax=Bacillus methanolicus TaxID=1471 RepID=UPI00200C47EE|nr:M67 family metallopeptidase [Bacillus methanolicus]UQD51874.1 peptidase [Bacillus methanolicus]
METNGIKNNIDDKGDADHFEIRRTVYEDMIVYCRKALPYEACGLLSGVKATGSNIWKLKNESLNPNRFYMSKGAIKLAVKKMEENGEELTGIFHSHPSSPAFPSSCDIENNPYTHLAYFIVSFYKGKVEVGCFKMDGNTVTPLKLIIIDD